MARLSPSRVSTVSAGPTQRPLAHCDAMPVSMRLSRSMASPTLAVGYRFRLSMSPEGALVGRGLTVSELVDASINMVSLASSIGANLGRCVTQ